MPQTLIEKIAQRFAVGLPAGHVVHAGDYLTIQPAHVMTHDNTGAVIPKFKSIGAKKVFNPRQVVFTLDHNVQDTGPDNLAKYAKIQNFAKEHGIDFYPAGRGIGHQIMCEEGYAWPCSMAVASDSHSNTYGGIGCLGTPVVRTDAASLWATGKTWWQVPPIARVTLHGKLRAGVSGKDMIIALCGYFNKDEVLNHAVEFAGEGVASLTISERLAIANMTTEWGVLAAVFPADEVVLKWLRERAAYLAKRGLSGVPSDADGNGSHPRINDTRLRDLESSLLHADKDAYYVKELSIDLNAIEPYISGPNTVKKMSSARELAQQNVKIHKAYLLSCVNGRLEDLAEAASVMKGKKVAAGVEFYVAAASNEIQAESEKRGDWKILMDAGAIELPPGCGVCIGLGRGTLAENEVGISATNRNFKGRMGAPSSIAYLASPAVVAASAISGKIDIPQSFEATQIIAKCVSNPKPETERKEVPIIDGFPSAIEGEIIFCHQDNLNTDGIYPGKYTYNDDFTPEQQAGVVMENYDQEFGKIVKKGDLLAGGFNFGTGSSREQAATALKYRGLALVLAGSFSETYKRNALNNGYLVIEAPQFIRDLLTQFGTDKLTVRTAIQAKVDFRKSIIEANGKSYSIDPIGAAAQELVLAGGLENWVKQRL